MHYYNYKLDDVMEMESIDYQNLSKLMLINEARKKVSDLETSIYHQLKNDKRSSIFKKYYKIAYPSDFEVKNVVKLSDLNRVLK